MGRKGPVYWRVVKSKVLDNILSMPLLKLSLSLVRSSAIIRHMTLLQSLIPSTTTVYTQLPPNQELVPKRPETRQEISGRASTV